MNVDRMLEIKQETVAAEIRANIRDGLLEEARVATEQAILALQNAERSRDGHLIQMTVARASVEEKIGGFRAATDDVHTSLQLLSAATVAERKAIMAAADEAAELLKGVAEKARQKLAHEASIARGIVQDSSDNARATLISEWEQDE